jgi:putative heme-binding domain-containing protein
MRVRAQRINVRQNISNKRELIESYSVLQPANGNPLEGEKLYQKHCAACHSSIEGRDPIGASLENLSKVDTDTLLVAILDPNRAVAPQYHQYLLQLLDGRTVTGRLINETSNSIKIATPDGKQFDIGRDEIETIKNTGISLMPEGFENALSQSQMQNLIHYLQNRRSTP